MRPPRTVAFCVSLVACASQVADEGPVPSDSAPHIDTAHDPTAPDTGTGTRTGSGTHTGTGSETAHDTGSTTGSATGTTSDTGGQGDSGTDAGACWTLELGDTVGYYVAQAVLQPSRDEVVTGCAGSQGPDVTARWIAPRAGRWRIGAEGVGGPVVVSLRASACGEEVTCVPESARMEEWLVVDVARRGEIFITLESSSASGATLHIVEETGTGSGTGTGSDTDAGSGTDTGTDGGTGTGDGTGTGTGGGTLDADGDGVPVGLDCDDTRDDVYPGAQERCTPTGAEATDEDCDTLVDDADPDVSDQRTWFFDGDLDGFGDPGVPDEACVAASHWVALDTDCDDVAPDVHPGHDEIVGNERDDDCSGGAMTELCFVDADQDGARIDATVASLDARCSPGDGEAPAETPGGDCDDGDPARSPTHTEACDANDVDEDCDGYADDADAQGATGTTTQYRDADGDSHAGAIAGAFCDVPVGWYDAVTDCDDTRPDVNPDALERCALPGETPADEDCDTLVDDDDLDVSDPATWYADGDGDGYGNDFFPDLACVQPEGFVADSTDCDEVSAYAADVNPGVDEVVGNERDDDCSGGATMELCFVDADQDGARTDATVASMDAWCNRDAGEATRDVPRLDCDDHDPARSPLRAEACDAGNVDEDCDGTADDGDGGGASGKVTAYYDGDNDGAAGGTSAAWCDAPSRWYAAATDCNDANAGIRPVANGGAEACDAGNIDEDCDGAADDGDSGGASGKVTHYYDGDNDGAAGGTSGAWCDAPSRWYASATDCNDANAGIRPVANGGAEACDAGNVDEDCDGYADDGDSGGASGKVSFYRDADGDSWGTSATSTTACDQPSGYVGNTSDCDDSTALRKPGLAESCDGLDNNCDALVFPTPTPRRIPASKQRRDHRERRATRAVAVVGGDHALTVYA
ncbi:MAG: hypothetical protein RLZZ299_881, partial [Pseudomonadota bacterium]